MEELETEGVENEENDFDNCSSSDSASASFIEIECLVCGCDVPIDNSNFIKPEEAEDEADANANIIEADVRKVKILEKMFRIFCTHHSIPLHTPKMNCSSRFATGLHDNKFEGSLESEWDFSREPFPFCAECKNSLAQICILHDNIEELGGQIRKLTASNLCKIMSVQMKQQTKSPGNHDELLMNSKIQKIRRAAFERLQPKVFIPQISIEISIQAENLEPQNHDNFDEQSHHQDNGDNHDNNSDDEANKVNEDYIVVGLFEVEAESEEEKDTEKASPTKSSQDSALPSTCQIDDNFTEADLICLETSAALDPQPKILTVNPEERATLIDKLFNFCVLQQVQATAPTTSSTEEEEKEEEEEQQNAFIPEQIDLESESERESESEDEPGICSDSELQQELKLIEKELEKMSFNKFTVVEGSQKRISWMDQIRRKLGKPADGDAEKGGDGAKRKRGVQKLGGGKFSYRQEYGFSSTGEGKKLKCDGCGEIESTRTMMILHIRDWHVPLISNEKRHYKDKMTQVSDGSFLYDTKWPFKKSQLEPNRFECVTCGKLEKFRGVMFKHINEFHILGRKHICSGCGGHFKSLKRLKSHVCEEQNPVGGISRLEPIRTVKLGDGKFLFRGEYPFSRLNEEQVGEDGLDFQCGVGGCDKKCKGVSSMRDHMRNKHADTHRLVCHLCGKNFSDPNTFRLHQSVTHSSRRNYKCAEPDCGKSFKTPTALKIHQVVHIKDANFECSKEGCGKKFTTDAKLKRHSESQHSNLEKTGQKCGECGHFYKSKALLKIHMDRHAKKLVFFCSVCNKGFLQKWQLTRHLATKVHGPGGGDTTNSHCHLEEEEDENETEDEEASNNSSTSNEPLPGTSSSSKPGKAPKKLHESPEPEKTPEEDGAEFRRSKRKRNKPNSRTREEEGYEPA